jgi:hypothetical protein
MGNVYKKIEVVGCSSESIEGAIEAALAKASESVRGMAWFEVLETRGAVAGSSVAEYQVTLNVAFKID